MQTNTKQLKILLIDPGMRLKRFSQNRFINRGLLSIATFLKDHGFKIKYFSFDQFYLRGINNFNQIISKLKKNICQERYNLVALSNLFIAEWPGALKILRLIKKDFPIITTVVGGYYPTFENQQLIRHACLDFIIRGEGEWAFLNLLNHLVNNKNISHLKSITYLDHKNKIKDTPLLPLGNLSKLPPLDYSIIDPAYLSYKNPPNINLEFNRGCYFNCSFCSVSRFWQQRIRFHNIEKLIAELKQLTLLGYQGRVSFEDATLDIRSPRFKKFFNQVSNIPRQYQFDYLTTRYDSIDSASLNLLAGLGFKEIVISLESASKKILELANKPIDLKKFKNACKNIKQHKINTSVFLIIGLPGETRQTFKETYDYVNSLIEAGLVSNFFVSHFQPYACTQSAQDLKKYCGKIIVKENNFSNWIYRSKPLVEYPHLSRTQLQNMLQKISKLNTHTRSKFINRF